MAKKDYTALIEQLKTVSNEPSDSGNRRGYKQARAFIMNSALSDEDKETIRFELHSGADTNEGYYYNSNGVVQAIEAISKLSAANDDLFDPQPLTKLTIDQFIAKAETGKIFSISFIKRTTGELRMMTARLGVKKFLKGGELAYSPAKKQLLTVFDMSAKGYRSIPYEGIKQVSIEGQSYCFGGVS